MRNSQTLPVRCFDLFLISFTILFLELAAIRWFPAYVLPLAFFTNWVLLAAFVGMSVGCLACERRWTLFDYMPTLIAVSCGAALVLYVTMGSLTGIRVGNQYKPELVYFGIEGLRFPEAKLALPMELVLAVLFVLVGMWFIGLGQMLGRTLAAIDQRILAYTVNIAGSLAGIVAFGVMAYFELPPVWWFAVATASILYFLRPRGLATVPNITLLACTLVAMAVAGWRILGQSFYWSPYYAVRYQEDGREISVNGIGHQKMLGRSEGGSAYALPYVLRRDAGLPPIQDVLVIGAGSGTDVAHALGQDVAHVDAVEIDPAIARLGRENHPDRPYDDPRVRVVVDDGRAFLRRTDGQYDLIVYGLVDSLTLHSSFSSIRLENFLFTEEAFADIRRRLKPGGWFVAYNYYRQGWIVARLAGMMHKAFGSEPLVVSLPGRDEIRDTEDEHTYMAVLLAGDASAVAPVRQKFVEHGSFNFFGSELARHETENGFESVTREAATGSSGVRLVATRVVESRAWKLPTDDWPFLYLRDPRIPSHNWRGLAILLVLSLGMLGLFAPARSLRMNPHFFFLGAGFMLIETKSVTQAAQLFGSTWLVNSVVFAGILVLILLANLFVLLARPRRLLPYYVGLALTLLLSWWVPVDWFLADSVVLRMAKSMAALCGPILFAGVIFASSFGRAPSPDAAFGANIAGVVLGGLLEYLSLIFGYRFLIVIAAGLYALSLVGARRVTGPASG